MRWKHEVISRKKPCTGDTNRYTKFLLFPKRLEYETRWLEVVTIEQVYVGWHWDDNGEYHYSDSWKDVRFID